MNDSPLRTESLFRLTWPIFLQHVTGNIVMLVDFVFFAYISDEVAATVGQVIPVTWLGTFLIPVFAGTGIAVASQYMGARQFDKVVPSYMMNLTFSFVLSVSLATVFFIYRSDIGVWMGLTTEQNAIATEYLTLMCAFFVVLSVVVSYNAILSSRGLTNWMMFVSLVSSFLNVILNTIFLFVMHWGLRGILIGTILSTATSMSISIILVHSKLGVRFYLKGAWQDMMGVLRPMLKVGIPNAAEPFSYATQQIVLSTFIISMGVTAMASNSYASRTLILHIVLSFSLASASQILMAHWMGARRTDEINSLYWKIVGLSMVVALIYMSIIWLNANTIMSIFTDDPVIKETAKHLLFISLFTEPARVVNIISGFTLRSVGDTRYPMIVSMIFIWGILPFIFAWDAIWTLSIVNMWICFSVDEILRCIINLHRWKSGKWRSMSLVRE